MSLLLIAYTCKNNAYRLDFMYPDFTKKKQHTLSLNALHLENSRNPNVRNPNTSP